MKQQQPAAPAASARMTGKPGRAVLLQRAASALKALFAEAEAGISSEGAPKCGRPQEGIFQPPKY